MNMSLPVHEITERSNDSKCGSILLELHVSFIFNGSCNKL